MATQALEARGLTMTCDVTLAEHKYLTWTVALTHRTKEIYEAERGKPGEKVARISVWDPAVNAAVKVVRRTDIQRVHARQ